MSNDASDVLVAYLRRAPAALALLRAIECREIGRWEMEPPVLDLGCGDGVTARVLREQGQANFAAGLDHSIQALRMASQEAAHGALLCGDLVDLPLQSNSIRTVVSNCVLEHIHGLSSALKEIRRVLRPRGRLICTVPTTRASSHLLGAALLRGIGLVRVAKAYTRWYDNQLGHMNLCDADAWERLLRASGFDVIACKPYASPLVLRLHDGTAPLAMANLLWRRLTGRWVVCDRWRQRVGAPLMAAVLRGAFAKDGPEGCSLFLVAESV